MLTDTRQYIVTWPTADGSGYDFSSFESRAAAEKFAEMRAESTPGVLFRVFEEVAGVSAEVKPRVTWTGTEAPKTPWQNGEPDPWASLYDAHCNKRLRAEGKPYPRTCAICKFGPCRGPVDSPCG